MPQKRAVKFLGLSKWVGAFHATPARLEKILPLPLNSFNVFSQNTEPKDTSKFYTDLIRQCIQSKSISDLRTIQTHMIKSGFSHLSLGNKLIDAFLKCGSIEEARNLFDELPQRHIVTWNSMISSYISQRRSEEAVKLYNRMVLERAFPDEFTFSSIFKAFSQLDLVYEGRRAHGQAVVFGLEVSNAFVGSSLVDMYAKFGKFRDARMVLDRVAEKDVVLVTALIVGFAQHGRNVEALEVFKEMIDEGIEANGYTFASILSSCANLKDLLMGMLIHGLVIRSGFEFAVAAQTSLLTMYSKCGLVDDSLKVFKQIIEPNQVTWTSLITGLSQNGREEIALSKFRRMLRSSISPNAFTFSSVLRACSSLAMLEQGKQIHAMVAKYGLSGDTFTGAALIDFYGKCGITEMARLAFDRLSKLDVVSLNTMIYSYAQNGYGNEALKLFNPSLGCLVSSEREGIDQDLKLSNDASQRNHHNFSSHSDSQKTLLRKR
ncbi:Pentatricopeptide repeat [Dillenia turbinata]|uniref:Pentatricopeptide repeat n=1 Tax=Dillenia turbinata TaxID=194707 RepID=A0AAN8Z3W9_9MAGN